MSLKEKQLSAEYKFKGKIINLRLDEVLLPDGKKAAREIVEHNGGVTVAAITENDELLFVEQYRHPYEEIILELPAGKRNSPDEDPLSCGKRELMEETGAVADNFIFLGELYPTPGYCSEIIYMYAATGLCFGDTCLDDGEFLYIKKIPFKKAVEMVLTGEIKDAKTQVAILKLDALRKDNKI